jgi:rhodanese-related sulfurtransferase
MQNISPQTAKQWLDGGEALLVDVREPAEHRAQSIPGSTLIPLSKICGSALPNLEGRKLIIHCLKGGRGASACQRLLSDNPALEVFNLEGGIHGWVEAALPTHQSQKYHLPLDRQVQLSIGVLLLSFLGLAWILSPAFLAGVAFIGLGLTLSGLTGFCGMARVLAKMPWNQS